MQSFLSYHAHYILRGLGLAAIIFILSFARPYAQTSLPSVVSLNVCADPYLMSFAAAKQILALAPQSLDPSLSPFSDSAAQFPSSNGGIEDLMLLQPDLVILSPYTSANKRNLIEATGIPTITIDAANRYTDARDDILILGEAIGRAPQAQQYLRELDRSLKNARQDKLKQVSLLALQRRGMTVGKGHVLDDIMQLSGAINLGRQGNMAMSQLGLEAILEKQPDFILLSGIAHAARDRGSEILVHPRLRKQFSNKKIITLDAALTLCAGASTPRAVSQLRRAIADKTNLIEHHPTPDHVQP